MKNKNNIKLNTATAYYVSNITMALLVIMTICLMFYIQFKVDNIQDIVNEVDTKIVAYEDEIGVLEVEWVYLTRPERLRILSQKYLGNNNDYIASNQVKDVAKLEKYSLSKLEEYENKQLAMSQ